MFNFEFLKVLGATPAVAVIIWLEVTKNLISERPSLVWQDISPQHFNQLSLVSSVTNS